MTQSSQKLRIFSQLQQIRSQSLNEYFTSNLSSFVNKQVITDILNRFLIQHEDQFLHHITDTIIQVKQQCKKIKQQLKQKYQQENIIKLKIQETLNQKYQNQMESFFKKWLDLEQLCHQVIQQKSPNKAIKKLQSKIEELNHQIINSKQYQQKFNKLSETQSAERQIIRKLEQELQMKGNQIKNLNSKILQNQNEKNQFIQKIHTYQQTQTQWQQKFLGQQKIIESQIKIYEQNVIKLNEALKLNSELALKSQNSQRIQNDLHKKLQLLSFLQTKVSQFKQQNTKLKHQIELIMKDKSLVQKQIQSFKKTIILLQSQQIRNKQQIKQKDDKLIQQNQKYRRLQQEKYKIKIQFTRLESHMQIAQNKIFDQQRKNKQFQSEHNRIINLLNSEKNMLNQTKSKQLIEIQTITKQLSQKKIQNEQLSSKLLQKQQLLKQYIALKDQQIHQIQQELHMLRNQLSSRQMNDSKQYQMYLQQIVQLKQKLKKLSPSAYNQTIQYDMRGKNIQIVNKRSRLYFMMMKVKQQLRILSQEKLFLQKYIKQQMEIMKIDMKAIVAIIGKKMMSIKLKCDYCQHHQIANYVKNIHVSSSIGNHNINKNKFNNQSHESQYNNNFGKILNLRPNNIGSANSYDQKLFNSNENDNKIVSSTKINKNIKKLNQKMKILNQQNSSYQIHLNKILLSSEQKKFYN